MRLFVAGASGRTGRLLVRGALDRGHEVTALVRDRTRAALPGHEHLTVVEGDVMAGPDRLATSIADCAVVVSLLAPRHERDVRIYSEGTANLLAAMGAVGVTRLVAVSAEGVRVARGTLPLAYRAVLLLPGLDTVYDDIGEMEEAVMASDLVWTLVRPAVLTDGPATDAYRSRVGDVVPGGLLVSRADLARFLLVVVEQDRFRCEKVALAQ